MFHCFAPEDFDAWRKKITEFFVVPGGRNAISESNGISVKRVLDKPTDSEENGCYLTSDSPGWTPRLGQTVEWRLTHKNPKGCGSLRVNMREANKYYVTVAVDQRIVPGVMVIHAANKEVAAEKAEMKVATQIRDAISVKAVNVREG
jgi:hypothetical protein